MNDVSAGDGGDGYLASWLPTSFGDSGYFAGGAGGGIANGKTAGAGGLGGGGTGGGASGSTAGVANTGGGGGGAGSNSLTASSGGSGVVIVRYRIA